MPKTRRNHNAEFKAKVALEALSGMQTLGEIASKYEIHPIVVGKWKKQLQEKAAEAFESDTRHGKEIQEKDDQISKLYQTVGQREYELVWLKKKMGIKS